MLLTGRGRPEARAPGELLVPRGAAEKHGEEADAASDCRTVTGEEGDGASDCRAVTGEEAEEAITWPAGEDVANLDGVIGFTTKQGKAPRRLRDRHHQESRPKGYLKFNGRLSKKATLKARRPASMMTLR